MEEGSMSSLRMSEPGGLPDLQPNLQGHIKPQWQRSVSENSPINSVASGTAGSFEVLLKEHQHRLEKFIIASEERILNAVEKVKEGAAIGAVDMSAFQAKPKKRTTTLNRASTVAGGSLAGRPLSPKPSAAAPRPLSPKPPAAAPKTSQFNNLFAADASDEAPSSPKVLKGNFAKNASEKSAFGSAFSGAGGFKSALSTSSTKGDKLNPYEDMNSIKPPAVTIMEHTVSSGAALPGSTGEAALTPVTDDTQKPNDGKVRGKLVVALPDDDDEALEEEEEGFGTIVSDLPCVQAKSTNSRPKKIGFKERISNLVTAGVTFKQRVSTLTGVTVGSSDQNGSDSTNTKKMLEKKMTVHQLKEEQAEIENSMIGATGRASGNMLRVAAYDGQGSVQKHSKFKQFVKGKYFTNAVAILIILNAIVIAVQTDWEARSINEDSRAFFDISEAFFCICFSIELAMQLCAQKLNFFHGKDWKWNVFDAIVVLAAISELFLKALAFKIPGIMAFRVLRVLRLTRTLRVVRVMRQFRELRMVLSGIMNSIASLVWLVLILLLIMYIFGVYFTEINTLRRKDLKAEGKLNLLEAEANQDMYGHSFGSLGLTLYVLYQAISGGDDWARIADPLVTIHPIHALVFTCYVTFSVFAVLNVVTGVFVSNAQKATDNDTDHQVLEDMSERSKHIEKVQEVFNAADNDGSGQLEWEEFLICFEDPRIRAYFRFLKLDVEGFGPDRLFQLFDFDGDGTVDIDEFVMGCTRLRGPAKSLDVAYLQHECKKQDRLLDEVKEMLQALANAMNTKVGKPGSETIV